MGLPVPRQNRIEHRVMQMGLLVPRQNRIEHRVMQLGLLVPRQNRVRHMGHVIGASGSPGRIGLTTGECN